MQTLRRTPLYERHAALGARLVPFAGWEMPVQYTSIVGEHRAVRTSAGVFDVSHMGQLRISGDGAHDYLQARLSNNLDKASDGDAQYTLLTNEQGGIVDDLIAYRRGTDDYLLVVNASNVEPDHAALSETEDVSADWALNRRQALHIPRGRGSRRRLPDRRHRLHRRARLRAGLRAGRCRGALGCDPRRRHRPVWAGSA